ncbi:MAG: hypothetical protein C0624_08715 [Desulfuromonas sp.]|nr:MAG: hypothetical protein C0624_08715 [Desulfuromonas sp.]
MIMRWLFSVRSLILLLMLVLAGGVIFQVPQLVELESELLSLRAGMAPVPPESPVVALRLKEQEFSRDQLAALLVRLTEQRVRAVLLYLPLTSPASDAAGTRMQSLVDEWNRTPGAAHNKLWQRIKPELRTLQREFDGDAQLGRALRESGNVVLVSSIQSGPEADETLTGLAKYTLKLDIPQWNWSEKLKRFSNPVPPPWAELKIASVALPWDPLLRQAAAAGFAPEVENVDSVPGLLLMAAGERYYPAASLATLVVAEGATFRELKYVARGASSVLLAGKRSLPIDAQLRLLPLPESYLAPLPVHTTEVVYAADGEEGLLSGKTVVIGRFDQPGAQEFTEARMLSQLLGDFQLSRPGWVPLVELLVLSYFAFFLWLVVPRLPVRTAWFLMGVFLLAWMVGSTVLLVNLGWWLQLSPPFLLTVMGMILLVGERTFAQRRLQLAELNCHLGQMLQEKGMLDQALERFKSCPVGHDGARELLYQLGLDYERKRRFGQALGVYELLAKRGRYKDVGERLERLRAHNGRAPLGKPGKDATVVLEQGAVHPTLGRYEVVSELGQGAMGTVYLGRDPKINREVAIKTLAYSGVDDTQLPMIKDRFFREAEAAGRLNHPGIVTIFDAGEEHDLAYLAMEFLNGKDLATYCKPGTLLSPYEVMTIVADVADALGYAHDNEVVHRDIKPANIMRLSDNSVKVTDFGIARVVSNSQTQTGMVLGTPSYMSPEQVAAKKVDGRSDLFSLGSVCYELLCGEKAFVGDSMASLMYNISNLNFMPLREKNKDLPKCCYELIDSLLVKAVSRRPKNAFEVAAAARACSEKARK